MAAWASLVGGIISLTRYTIYSHYLLSCVMRNQVEWYRNASLTLSAQQQQKGNRNSIIPAQAFFHIPLYEHLDLWNTMSVYGDLEDEGVCCSAANTGLYAAMREVGDIKAVHCGMFKYLNIIV